MSVTGYLGKEPGELGMGKEGNDVGGTFRGPVLEGEKSVEVEMKMDAVKGSKPRRARYSGVEKYDPVLRNHCRL